MTSLILAGTMIAAPLAAQSTAQPATSASPAPAGQAATAPSGQAANTTTAPASAAASVTQGASVVDTQGGAVGTIESVANGVAVLSTGTNKVSIPTTSFAKGSSGLVIAMTKAEIDAKAAAATAAASAPPEITVGATVSGPAGASIGTVKAINGDLVTVTSANATAQLPKSSIAKGPSGLVIGMTPAQFEAAAKAAGGTKSATAN